MILKKHRIPFYFAYGANLDAKTMANRCPSATGISKAVLQGYRFIINSRGKSTVVPDDSSRVYGFLWTLSPDDEIKLDDIEGVPKHYTKQRAAVVCLDNPKVEVFVYVATNSVLGEPSEGYLDNIIENAKRLGFPAKYVGYLERLKCC